jgi:hypothetical protein
MTGNFDREKSPDARPETLFAALPRHAFALIFFGNGKFNHG